MAFVAPFLLILAVSGAVCLYGDRLDDALYPDLRFVPPHTGSVFVSQMAEQAVMAHPGLVTRIDVPAAVNRSVVVFITPFSGPPLRVWVDPGTALVLGAKVYALTPVGLAQALHRSLGLATLGKLILELVACWTIVLMAAGLYRARPWGSGRGTAARRAHRAGLWFLALPAAAAVGFVLLTGLIGTGVEGRFLKLTPDATGLGYPAYTRLSDIAFGAPAIICTDPSLASKAPNAGSSLDPTHHDGEVTGLGADPTALRGLDAVVETLNSRGLAGDYHLMLPAGPTGVYTAYTDPDRPQGQRTLHIDRYSGRVIREVAYSDYGAGAKALEIGAQIHRGVYFGRFNRILMLAACVGIAILALVAVTLAWRFRPMRLSEVWPMDAAAAVADVLPMLVIAGLFMPLLGAALVATLIVERLTHALVHADAGHPSEDANEARPEGVRTGRQADAADLSRRGEGLGEVG